MHEATIFRISGRVDFLEMPILDRLEEKEEEWGLKSIPEINKGQDSITTIMREHYFQQIPLKIKGYADFIELRQRFNTDPGLVAKFENNNFSVKFIDFKNIKKSKMMHNYKYLRTQNDNISEGEKRKRFFIYDEELFSKDVKAKDDQTNLVREKNPFNGIFNIHKVVYGESVHPFYTLASKKSAQKFICNIGSEAPVGNLNISIVHPLYLRYMYLTDYMSDDYTRYSDLDLFNPADEGGKFNNFNYDIVNHATLSPGDCIYIPSNYWTQIDNRMHEKLPGSTEPLYEKYLPKDERENVKWVEYEYTDLSYLEGEALDALERGYGS
mmetsp:Transcript_32778/g.29066  ORF Transcript_32778/g.29066 Transcript_32778/m.29066 type:complete len:325 (+) Transcript_32778:146-1120(+)